MRLRMRPPYLRMRGDGSGSYICSIVIELVEVQISELSELKTKIIIKELVWSTQFLVYYFRTMVHINIIDLKLLR